MTHIAATVPLDSITAWLSGGTPNRANPRYWGGEIPWISAASLKETCISGSDQHITDAAVRAGSRLAPEGATLVLVRGMALHHETRIGLATRPVGFNQDVKALIPKSGIVPEFLVYSLQARSRQILDLVSSAGSGTGVLDTGLLKRLPIWLPSPTEQVAIVSSIRAAAQSVLALETLITKKRAIKQSIMQQLLTGRTRLPGFGDPWLKTSLGTLGILLKGRGIKRDEVRTVGIPCIRYGELYTTFNDYTSETRSFVTPEVAEAALPLKSGDLLFAGSGETRDEIGKCVAYIGREPAVAGGDLVVLRGSGFNSVYLALLANTPAVVNQKARMGQGDAVVHISSRALASIKIELPPPREQDAVAAVILDVDLELEALHRRLSKACGIKASLMQQLFTGRTRLPAPETTA